VPQAAELRTRLREADATFRVVKNTLTERAADAGRRETLKALLEGPTALTFVRGDAALGREGDLRLRARGRTRSRSRAACSAARRSTPSRSSRSRACPRATSSSAARGRRRLADHGLVRTLNALIAGLASQLRADRRAARRRGAARAPGARPGRPDQDAEASEPRPSPDGPAEGASGEPIPSDDQETTT
jgi:large subunit ribosomal protein L10